VARHKSPRVKKNWLLLEKMQRLIEDENVAPNDAAELMAAEHWPEVSKNRPAGVQWFKDNQRKFRNELDSWLVFYATTQENWRSGGGPIGSTANLDLFPKYWSRIRKPLLRS
jgi:hypothetical protein